MDIRKLRILLAVIEQRSFTGAAKQMYMTQPAISHAILDLEKELDTVLFHRYPKQVLPTPAGALLAEKARQLLAAYDELEEQAHRLETSAAFRLGSSITIANGALCPLVAQCQKQFPGMVFRVQVASAGEILRRLGDSQLDAALVEGVVEGEAWARIPFSSYRIQGVCSPAFWEKHPIEDLDSLCRAPLLLREPGSAIRDVLDSALLLQGHRATPQWESTNSGALLQGALWGFGVTFLPGNLVEKQIQRGRLRALELPELQLSNENYLVYPRQHTLYEPLKGLIRMVESWQAK